MTKVHAIFENGVFRPTEPVQVDDGTRVELSFEEPSRTSPRPTITTRASDGLPIIILPPGTKPITSEAVASGLEDE